MTFTDPTYLRTIHDGLLSGSVHKDNASALPMGLVGMYEEALPASVNVNERKKFLEFFAVWALLKKEVSTEFVTRLLENWTDEQVIDYIAQYSKLFNSPVSGKYVLYHERLRSFILQKVSADHFKKCNEHIIHQCQLALHAKTDDEWERYALEFLSTHLLIQAIDCNDGETLKSLSYNTTHWNRQVEISKGFEWSKRMLNDMMLWASKFDDDEVIECALNKVDLHHLEQNDAPRIVELVAENDIETALQRIESFGGNDKEGLQRKFILYMLCLMELTLLDSKNKPFRKEAIGKLLKHLDDNLPVDDSVLNWNDFFPSYTVFLLACEWRKLGLDYLHVYNRTTKWESDWIETKGPYNDLQFNVLLVCARIIKDEYSKSIALHLISNAFAHQGQIEEAIDCAQVINEMFYKCSALAVISTEIARLGDAKKASDVMQEAISIARICERARSFSSSQCFKKISIELGKQAHFGEALLCARGIQNTIEKSLALVSISNELFLQGNVNEAESLIHEAYAWVREAGSEKLFIQSKIKALLAISTEMVKLEKTQLASAAMVEAISCANGITNEINKGRDWVFIVTEMVKQGKIEEALFNAKGMKYYKLNAFVSISIEVARQGKFIESVACANIISDPYTRSFALVAISREMAIRATGNEASSAIKDALGVICEISGDATLKNLAFKNIYAELLIQGHLREAFSVMQEALFCLPGLGDNFLMDRELVEISINLANNGRVKEAQSHIQGIKSKLTKSEALATISTILTIEGQTELASTLIQEALYIARGNSKMLVAICSELGKQGKLDEVSTVIQEALSCSRTKGNIAAQSDEFAAIARLLAKLGKIEEALSCAAEIDVEDINIKNKAIRNICRELAKQCRFEEAFKYASQITDKLKQSQALRDISYELAEQGRKEDSIVTILEALNLFRNLNDEKDKVFLNEKDKVSELLGLSSSFMELGQLEESNDLLNESLSIARDIGSDYWRSIALMKIAIELSKKLMFSEAEVIGIEIPQKVTRQICWKEISELVAEKDGWQKAFEHISNLKNQDVQKHYLKGLGEIVKTSDFDKTLLLSTWRYYKNDIVSMETLLQHYALHELFFNNASPEKIERYNRTLNIQWAIDIKNSFSDN